MPTHGSDQRRAAKRRRHLLTQEERDTLYDTPYTYPSEEWHRSQSELLVQLSDTQEERATVEHRLLFLQYYHAFYLPQKRLGCSLVEIQTVIATYGLPLSVQLFSQEGTVIARVLAVLHLRRPQQRFLRFLHRAQMS